MKNKCSLIVALDVENLDKAKALVSEIGDSVQIYKVGFQLFTAYGPEIVKYLESQGKEVFLDLKFHDIPNTVAKAVQSAIQMSPAIILMTVHTQGGEEMMSQAARSARETALQAGIKKPQIVGVTVLTSEAKTDNIPDLVLQRALLAKKAGCDGVVASPQEARIIRRECGDTFTIVTPGIRPADSSSDDQKRIATPAMAVQAGSNFLVVGRPIVQAHSPRESAKKILEEINTFI